MAEVCFILFYLSIVNWSVGKAHPQDELNLTHPNICISLPQELVQMFLLLSEANFENLGNRIPRFHISRSRSKHR